MVKITKAELRLWIYDGDVNAVRETPDYILTKSRLNDDDTITFEVSELIKDYVKIEFDGNYAGLKQTMWVKYEVHRTYDDATTDSFSQHNIAFRGYGEVIDGINPELSKDVLISNTVINNRCGYPISVPFYTLNGDGIVEISYIDEADQASDLITGSVTKFTIAQNVKVNPPATDVITIDKTHSTQSNSEASTEISEVPVGSNEVTYTDAENNTSSIPIVCIDECEYKSSPHKVSFINKFGVMQDVWFFARRKDSITSEREQYKRNTLNIGTGVASYNISDHQRVYLENQGRETITMNTGYIHESYSEVMKQLLVSEFVYIHDDTKSSPSNHLYDLAVPVNLVTNSLDIKTRRDDKLINYELQFEADSEFIQSIR